MSTARQSQEPTPTGTAAGPSGVNALAIARTVWRAIGDPRYTRVQRLAFWLPLLLVVVAVIRIPGGTDWSQRISHGWYHLFVVFWFLLATYKLRTVGFREVVRLWVTGFFPVALATFVLTEPIERLIGTGNLQTGLIVPVTEEVIKVLPLLAWTTILRPRHRHGTLTDFWVLGFALGAGFSFYEDALYGRLAASGFGDGLSGTLFPIFLTGRQFVITHAGWTALAAVGVGVFSLYRRRAWAWVIAAALVGVAVLDHAAVNWRGGGSELMRTIVANGDLGALLLLLSVVACIAHDVWMLKWAGDRDRWFPPPPVRGDLAALTVGTLGERLETVSWRQRYRRFRNAAFTDLYRVRSTGGAAGDRTQVIAHFDSLAARSGTPTNRAPA